jgi:chemotaxis protein MotA
LIRLESTGKELVMEGVVAIANGENPRLIEARLRSLASIND